MLVQSQGVAQKYNKPAIVTQRQTIRMTSANDSVEFKGHFRTNKLPGILSIQETAFFREMPTLEGMKKYIATAFKDRHHIRIANFGCSSGEEAYTMAMLLDDLPQKVEIDGYDLDQKAVDSAKRGISPIGNLKCSGIMPLNAFDDTYLAFNQDAPLTPEKSKYKKLFGRFFEGVSVFKARPSLKEMVINLAVTKATKYFEVKPDIKNRCHFAQGDITKLDEFIKPGSVDVLSFRNALYHLTTVEPMPGLKLSKDEIEVRPVLEGLFDKIHTALSEDGIFVLGIHSNDHELGPSDKDANNLIYKILKEKGFEPAFCEKTDSALDQFLKSCGIEHSLREDKGRISIWKKVNRPTNVS